MKKSGGGGFRLRDIPEGDPEFRSAIEEEGFFIRIADDLYDLMVEEGVSKAELARRLGVSKAYVTQIFSGGRNITLRTLYRISRELGRDCEYHFPKKRKKYFAVESKVVNL